MNYTVEDYFTDALKSTDEDRYFVCRRFDILLRKQGDKFYPALNHSNLIMIQMSVSDLFFNSHFLKYTPNED